jgi:transcriptional regulator with XRE-family HTH domain
MANSQTGAEVAPDTEIAARITDTLSAKDMSLLALSEETGIAYPTLRRSIKAGRSLSIHELGKIANALKVQPSTLLPATLTGNAA